jgi:cytochrome c biogenesis protein CcdA
MAEVNLPIVIGASLVDSINPCAFGVLIFLLAYLFKTSHDKRKMLINGIVYIIAVYITYFVAGLLLLSVIQKLGQFSVWAYKIIGVFVILAGIVEIKDYFFYGKWFSLTIIPGYSEKIKEFAHKMTPKTMKSYWHSTVISFLLGIFVSLVELPCTGAVYLAVLTMMSQQGFSLLNMMYLVLYNAIFVLPLFVIVVLVFKGVTSSAAEMWREKHKDLMRLVVGIVLIGMGVLMLWSVS